MTEPAKTLNNLYVASPCTADWDLMKGNDQVRFCQHCQSNVYNLSVMTKSQAESLITSTKGRLCTKFFRRADGTIMNKDCPIGLRAVRRRVSRVAGAALTAVLSLLASVGLSSTHSYAFALQDSGKIKIKRVKAESLEDTAVIQGTVFDVVDAVIQKAKVTITNEGTGESVTTETSEEGRFALPKLQEGLYTISVESTGFVSFKKKQITAQRGEMLELNITLQVGSVGGAAFLPPRQEAKSNLA
jgi:hypothetical protein